MREYGQIQCSYWTDPEIKQLSEQARTLGAYLLSGPHSNGLGCYSLPEYYVLGDFPKWSIETVRKAFRELFTIGFARRCEKTDFVLIPKFLFWNPITNGNVASARIKEFDTVPKGSQIYQALIESLQRYGKHFPEPFLNRLETLLKGLPKQDPTLPNPTLPKPDPTYCPEPDGSAQQQLIESEPALLTIPMLPKGSEFQIKQRDIDQWADTFPGVDILAALKRCRQWNLDNPKRQKTASGIRRHISTWLEKEQNSGRNRPANSQQPGTSGKLGRAAAAIAADEQRRAQNGNPEGSGKTGAFHGIGEATGLLPKR